jgi:hypothetical protein
LYKSYNNYLNAASAILYLSTQDLIKEEYRKHAVSLEGRLREDTDGSIGSAKNRFNLLSFLTLYVKPVYPMDLTYEKYVK